MIILETITQIYVDQRKKKFRIVYSNVKDVRTFARHVALLKNSV
jgi:hypothetical protein